MYAITTQSLGRDTEAYLFPPRSGSNVQLILLSASATPPNAPPPPAAPLGASAACDAAAACSLQGALALARADFAPAAIHLGNGSHLVNNSAPEFTFDRFTYASRVELHGDSGAVLRGLDPSAPLLRIEEGSPPITLRGLQIEGQIIINGARSSLVVEGCRMTQSAATDGGGALQIVDGTVRLNATELVNNSATKGGAVHVQGGVAVFESCTLTRNNAEEGKATAGGALHVDAGEVVLMNTLLQDNAASGDPQSIRVDGGATHAPSPSHCERAAPAMLVAH